MGHLRSRQRSLFGALKLTESFARRAARRDRGVAARGGPRNTRDRASRTKSRPRRPRTPAKDAPQGDVDPELARTAAILALRASRGGRGVPALCGRCTTPPSTASSGPWPTTLDELAKVPGIGDKKLEHYGDELLQIVRTR